MKVHWLNGAIRSLRQIHSAIKTENPAAALRVAFRIRDAVSKLGDFPMSGRIGTLQGTRELVIHGLPYIAVYRVTEKRVEIIRIFHTSRDWPPLMQ